MAMHGHSEACCTVPTAKIDYKEKGKYIDLKDGMKCYATGPPKATSAILHVFDIFGFYPQTLQGADLLAHEDDEHHQYQVFMPDFFRGKPFPLDSFPPDTDEKKKALGDFFGGPAKPPAIAAKAVEIVKELTARSNGTITKWGIVGHCWGGKIAVLDSFEGTVFSAAAECHPALVDPADAPKVTIPFAVLASGDENPDEIKGFEAGLKVPKHVETFSDQVHGWMAARADLKDARVKAEYERGWKVLLDFFHEHL